MNYLPYILGQSIGVYFKDMEWAKNLYEEIIDYLPKECISKIVSSQWNMEIILKPDTTINFVRVNDCSRGKRFDRVIIQPDIDKEIIHTIISPKFKSPKSKHIMVLNDDKSIDYV